jgi:outer membrane receptor protein involved in Fe transport
MTGYFRQTASGADISGLSAADQTAVRALRARFGAANSFSAKTSGDSLTGNLNLAYSFESGPLVYATYSRGYKAGGLNLSNINTAGANAVDPVIDPETIDSYETGLKSTWARPSPDGQSCLVLDERRQLSDHPGQFDQQHQLPDQRRQRAQPRRGNWTCGPRRPRG